MNKYELIREFKRRELPELSYKDCREIVEGVLGVMEDGLINTGEIKLQDFMSIRVVPSLRTSVVNWSGEKHDLGKRQRLKIKPSKKLKKLLNESGCTLS